MKRKFSRTGRFRGKRFLEPRIPFRFWQLPRAAASAGRGVPHLRLPGLSERLGQLCVSFQPETSTQPEPLPHAGSRAEEQMRAVPGFPEVGQRRVKGLTAIKWSCSRDKSRLQQSVISPAARRGPGRGRGRGEPAAEPIVWGAARRAGVWRRVVIGGAGRGGRGAARLGSPGARAPRARAVRLHRGRRTHARPAPAPRAGSARLAATWRVSGWSVWLIFAVLRSFPGLRRASFLGPPGGRQERPTVSKLSLFKK